MYHRCSLCGGLTRSYWRGFVKCSSCKLIRRAAMPTPANLNKFYRNGWLDPDGHKQETGGTDLDLARLYVRNLAASLGQRNFAGQSILDFGAGTGATLTALSELGARVHAVEPFGYDHLAAQGFAAYRDLSALPPGSAFDGIVTLDVIEHLDAPSETITRLGELLKPHGWIFIATPNPDSLNARVFRSYWREIRNAGHLMFFNDTALGTLLRRCGYREGRRLHWKLACGSALQNIKDYFLQSAHLDGELRYLARKGT